MNTKNKISNILETGFRLTCFNSLVAPTGEMIFRNKPADDQEKTFFINNGKHRGNYLRCEYRTAFPHYYKLSVVNIDGEVIAVSKAKLI